MVIALVLGSGVLRFNNSAKDGIKYLVSAGVLDDDPAEIAEFLAKQENLDKHVIGEYLVLLLRFHSGCNDLR